VSALGGIRQLRRRPLRTVLSILGIAVAAAMLLDMVMLSGGIEVSFARLLLGRGWQVRVSPKGTLPFDTEAVMPGASALLETLRRDPAVEKAGRVVGTSLHARPADAPDSLVALFGYGIDPDAQALYDVESGADLAPGDTTGVLLGATVAPRLRLGIGDTLTLVGRLDPQLATAGVTRRLVVRGLVRWLYDYRDQPSIGATVPVMQALATTRAPDPASVIMVRLREGVPVAASVERLRTVLPSAEVRSVEDLVVNFRQRLVYFRQLALILGSVSLVVTVLLVGTLLTITVNERLAEIATLRAIGVQRASILRQVMTEGLALVTAGGALGLVLGLVTARRLDAILTSFPGLPAAFSFFVVRPREVVLAAVVLLVTGLLAGLWPAWLAARAPIAATLRQEAT
jgi:putative ABC transport system permease protein